MKRLISFILSITMIILLMPAFALPASAATQTWTSGDCTVTLDDAGNMTISGNGAMANYGTTSTTKAPWNGKNISYVFIDNDVTNIGDYAFYNCGSLTNIDIPDTVTAIGEYAFYNCSTLTSIDIPDNVFSIGNWAFYGCTSLTSIDIPEAITSINDSTFRACASLTNITIPNNVTSIGSAAFYSCTNLENINLPNSIVSIGESAFGQCFSLSNISIPNNVISIGEYAFWKCTSLESIDIPNSVTSIGQYAFQYCSALTSIAIPNSVNSIDDWTFSNCSKLTNVYISAGITSIGRQAFENCTSLTSIDIPDSVSSFGYRAFYGCSALEAVDLPDSIIAINEATFQNCSSLTSISIPDSVTSVESYAFSGCTNLESIVIPDSVTSIGQSAFSGCSALNCVVLPDSITSIDDCLFKNCSALTSINIPNNVAYIGDSAFSGCIELTNIHCHADPESLTISNSAFSSGTLVHVSTYQLANYQNRFANNSKLSFVGDLDCIQVIDEQYLKTAATCTEPTVYHYVCADCGKQDAGTFEYGEPLGHTYSDWEPYNNTRHLRRCIRDSSHIEFGDHEWDDGVITTESTCTANGIITYTCNICGKTRTEEIEKKPHVFDQQNTDVAYLKTAAESCVDPAIYYYSCICGEKGTETFEHFLPAELANHTWNDGVITTPATCTTEGVMTYTCTECGATKTESIAIIPHTFDQQTISNDYLKSAATCTEPAVYYYSCTCGEKGTETFEYGLPNGHTWDDGIVTTPATCTAEGVMTYTCTECGATRTEPIAIIPHAFNQQVISNDYLKSAATCTEPAVYYYSCTCGEKGTDTFEYGLPNGHAWNDGVITTPATCTAEGVMTYTCTVCGATRTEPVDVIPHTFDQQVTSNDYFKSAATCTESAEYYYSCTCGEKGTETFEYGLPNGHNWNDGVVTTPATCTAEGVMTYTCTECGATKTEPITIIPHTFDQEVVSEEYLKVAGDSENKGIYYYSCQCGEKGTETFESYAIIGSWISGDCNVILFEDGTLTVSGNGSMCDYIENGAPWHEYNNAIKRININYGVTTIGCWSFFDCTNLTNVNFPNSLTNIESYAFLNCSLLVSINLPNSITHLGDMIFSGCTSLSSVTLPNSITSIPINSFNGCHSLENIVIPNGVTEIGVAAFVDCKSLNSLTIPQSVTKIGDSAFAGCESLTSINIPTNVTIIDEYTFFGCSSLESIVIPENVYLIKKGAFYGCSSLTDINIPSGINRLNWGTFYECASLESITIHEGINSIDDCAFFGCVNLANIYFQPSATGLSLGSNNFNYETTIHVYSAYLADYKNKLKYYKNVSVIGDLACIENGYHTWDEGTITTPPTCTAEGIITYTCAECNSTRTEQIAIIPHTFDQQVVSNDYLKLAATCTESAVYYYSCSCGEKGSETFEYGLPTGHSYGAWTTYNGKQHIRTCENDSNHVEYANHTWDDGAVTTPPTCTTEGVMTYTCTECGEARTEPIDIIPHTFDQKTISSDYLKTAATCTEPSVYYYSCTCGEKGTETFEHGLPNGHRWADIVVEPATTGRDGLIYRPCSECSAINDDKTVIPMASGITLSASSFVFSGEAQKPTVTVKDSNGNTIAKTDYTIKYSNKKSTEPGEYTIDVIFKNNYSGTETLTYQITPHKVKGLKASSIKKTKMKLSWTKVDEASYYLIEQSVDGVTWIEVGTTANTYKNLSGLEPGTNYRFRVSALDSTKTVSGKKSDVLKTCTLTYSPEVTKVQSESPRTLNVAWNEVDGAVSYTVYRSRDKKTWTAAKTGLTTTSCKLTGLKGGTIYIKVIAVNSKGAESAADAVHSADVIYYVLNTRSKTFHESTCGTAANMSSRNRKDVPSWSRSKCISEGYKPCGNCEP